tara:strand:+ start:7774 stop:8355 length:582 start_codon:yes stop_codon:yes gene_type:complete
MSLFDQEYTDNLDKFRKIYANVVPCRYGDVAQIFEDYHYKGKRIGGGITQCFALIYSHKIVGGSVLGPPRHSAKYPGAIDIRRMACIDSSPKNSESYFIGQLVKWIRKNTDSKYVLSYSDLTEGHQGTIYKASNFECVGETSPSKNVFWNGERYHPRSLSIDRPYSYKLREAVKKGEAHIIQGKPKKIWLFKL